MDFKNKFIDELNDAVSTNDHGQIQMLIPKIADEIAKTIIDNSDHHQEVSGLFANYLGALKTQTERMLLTLKVNTIINRENKGNLFTTEIKREVIGYLKNDPRPWSPVKKTALGELINNLTNMASHNAIIDFNNMGNISYDQQFLYAAENGDFWKGSSLLAFLKDRANINTTNDFGRTALHLTAEKGYVGAFSELLAIGVDINILDINGTSPQDIAIEKGHNNIIDYLKSLEENETLMTTINDSQDAPGFTF